MDTPNVRAATCGYCSRPLDTYFYRDLARTRGYFCSSEHCELFIANGKKGMIPGLKEDETTTLHDLIEEGYEDYEERDSQ